MSIHYILVTCYGIPVSFPFPFLRCVIEGESQTPEPFFLDTKMEIVWVQVSLQVEAEEKQNHGKSRTEPVLFCVECPAPMTLSGTWKNHSKCLIYRRPSWELEKKVASFLPTT